MVHERVHFTFFAELYSPILLSFFAELYSPILLSNQMSAQICSQFIRFERL